MNSFAWRRSSLLAVLILGAFTGVHLVNAEEEKGETEKKGVWIEREDGTRLNLLIEEQNFELHFFDEEEEEIEPNVAGAVLHYTSRIIRSRETLMLSPVEGEETTILASPRLIRPPYQFEILLVLNLDEAGRETETHHVIFRQDARPEDQGSLPPPPAAPR